MKRVLSISPKLQRCYKILYLRLFISKYWEQWWLQQYLCQDLFAFLVQILSAVSRIDFWSNCDYTSQIVVVIIIIIIWTIFCLYNDQSFLHIYIGYFFSSQARSRSMELCRLDSLFKHNIHDICSVLYFISVELRIMQIEFCVKLPYFADNFRKSRCNESTKRFQMSEWLQLHLCGSDFWPLDWNVASTRDVKTQRSSFAFSRVLLNLNFNTSVAEYQSADFKSR